MSVIYIPLHISTTLPYSFMGYFVLQMFSIIVIIVAFVLNASADKPNSKCCVCSCEIANQTELSSASVAVCFIFYFCFCWYMNRKNLTFFKHRELLGLAVQHMQRLSSRVKSVQQQQQQERSAAVVFDESDDRSLEEAIRWNYN